MKKIMLGTGLICVVALSGCTETGIGRNAATGAAMGGIAGAISGKRSGHSAEGAALGALGGGIAGYKKDEAERKRREAAEKRERMLAQMSPKEREAFLAKERESNRQAAAVGLAFLGAMFGGAGGGNSSGGKNEYQAYLKEQEYVVARACPEIQKLIQVLNANRVDHVKAWSPRRSRRVVIRSHHLALQKTFSTT